MRVAAAITSFNRLESLKRCIAHVRAQTWPLDEIIVVDDASTDGSGEWLAEQEGLVVVRQPENYGPSMSFHTAMRTAYERGHDWVWVMDDDTYPRPETLADLLEAADELRARGQPVGALKPFEEEWHRGGPTQLMFSLPRTLRRAYRYHYHSREVVVEMGRGEPVEVEVYPFSGALIPREALAVGGFPNPDFFYGCEDADFALRLRALGFRNFVVPRAVVSHAGAGFTHQRVLPLSANWRHYYVFRNEWRIVSSHGHLMGRPKKLACQLRIFRNALARAYRESRRANAAGARLAVRGLFDGFLGRVGKRVSPPGSAPARAAATRASPAPTGGADREA